MKRYALCSLLGLFASMMEGNESTYLSSADDLFAAQSHQAKELPSLGQEAPSYTAYPDSGDDLPSFTGNGYSISRCNSLASIEEFSPEEVSAQTSLTETVRRFSDSIPDLSVQRTGASSNSSLRSVTSSSDSPRSLCQKDVEQNEGSSSDSEANPSASRKKEKISTDSEIKSSSTPSDSADEEIETSAIATKRESRVQRVEPKIEEPGDEAIAAQYPLALNSEGYTTSMPFLDQIQQLQRFINPVVVVVNANTPSLQPQSQTSSPQDPVIPETSNLLAKNHQDTLTWLNPSDSRVLVREIVVTTGSLLSFEGQGMVSGLIRKFTKDPNSLGLSHVGIAIVASANEVLAIIEESARMGGLYFFKDQTEEIKKDMIQTIRNKFHRRMDEPSVFCIHSTGHMGVHVVPLRVLIDTYEGNIFVRRLFEPIHLHDFLSLLAREIGKRYDFNPNRLARCARDGNKTEQNDKTFCSQLVAILYRDMGILPPDIQANNVSPAEFDSRSPNDLLKGYADGEKVLKLLINTGGCCGCC